MSLNVIRYRIILYITLNYYQRLLSCSDKKVCYITEFSERTYGWINELQEKW